MAEDSSKHIIEYWAEIPRVDEDFLGSIRDWKNVKIALEDEVIWLKNFTTEQALSPEIQQLPNFLLYELRDGLLFRKEALVPTKKVRTALLWSPIDKALKLTFPTSNQNFFGIHEKVKATLKQSEEEQPATALLSSVSDIKNLIVTFPKFKLEKIDWIVMQNQALFVGTPLLSLPGKTYWEKDGHLLPTGFDFEFNNLSVLLQKKYNENLEQWLVWSEGGSYISIDKNDLRKLSVSSFRLTMKTLQWI